MNDEFNNNKKNVSDLSDDDFFAQFDKISSDFSNPSCEQSVSEEIPDNTDDNQAEDITSSSAAMAGATRLSRLSEKKKSHTNAGQSAEIFSKISAGFENCLALANKKLRAIGMIEEQDEAVGATDTMGSAAKQSRKKKYKLNKKKFAKFLISAVVAVGILLGIYTVIIVATSPPIDPDNIYSMLTETSVLYDDEGNIISTIGGTSQSPGNRTIVAYEEFPKELVEAVVAVEDKTFWDHNGFNFIRIAGAIRDSIFTGRISGTSTITQQLARNVYLTDRMSVRSLGRKISEAYYTVLIEKELSKEQIMEAYLNTIYLGFNSKGVQSASQAYFSKDVHELDLTECVALASLPQSPDSSALIKRLEHENVDPDKSVVIYVANDYTYVFNGERSEKRRNLTLKLMKEQGKITDEQYDAAMADNLLDHINPSMESLTQISSYFSDYVVKQVIKDLAKENHISEDDAKAKLYNGGMHIHTTMDSDMQKIAEKEFSNNANFPGVAGFKKDAQGNALSSSGRIMLYNSGTYFADDGSFVLGGDEFEWLSNGDLKIYNGKRLNFYNTVFEGTKDVNIEFKNLYIIENNTFYSVEGGVIAVPAEFKKKDSDNNCIISADYFKTNQESLNVSSDKKTISVASKYYTLRQKIVQPQSAMVITDYKTGQIKSMVGGRNTTGVLLYNRAEQPRQPGSSIKPITVYGAALQQSVDSLNAGTIQIPNEVDGNGNSTLLYGDYFTAASVIDDSPMTVGGKVWPKNWYNYYKGLCSLRYSVQQSINVNAVKVLMTVGVEYASEFGEKLGITSIVKSGDVNDMNVAALGLGGMTKGISPLEMASAYGTYPNAGVYQEPIVYTKVLNQSGDVILEKASKSEEVVDPGAAFLMTNILQSVVTEGLAGSAAIGSQPVGGKTGTTTDNYDAWFVGFTPQYSAALWIGNDLNMDLTQGSAAASRLWSKIMKQACAGLPAGSFPSAPSNIISVNVDTVSGQLPTAASALDERGTIRTEYFIAGTEPTTEDGVHQTVDACGDSGYKATPYCTNTYSRVGIQRPYAANPAVADLTYELPYYYCPLHNPNTEDYPIDPNMPEDMRNKMNNPDPYIPPSDEDGGNTETPIVDSGTWIN